MMRGAWHWWRVGAVTVGAGYGGGACLAALAIGPFEVELYRAHGRLWLHGGRRAMAHTVTGWKY